MSWKQLELEFDTVESLRQEIHHNRERINGFHSLQSNLQMRLTVVCKHPLDFVEKRKDYPDNRKFAGIDIAVCTICGKQLTGL